MDKGLPEGSQHSGHSTSVKAAEVSPGPRGNSLRFSTDVTRPLQLEKQQAPRNAQGLHTMETTVPDSKEL